MKTKKGLIVLGALLSLSCANHVAQAATRVGLFYTQEEINLWRNRIVTGPFVNDGDVQNSSRPAGASDNFSPGQWARVANYRDDSLIKDATDFKENPALDRFTNFYKGTGCVPPESDVVVGGNDPGDKGSMMVKAAFYFLVQGDRNYAAPVRNELISYAKEPALQFGDTTRWCPGGLKDNNPGFTTANWLTRMLVSYDILVARKYLSDEEKGLLDNWFRQAALYMRTNYDNYLDARFKNGYRAEPYVLSDDAKNDYLMGHTKPTGYWMVGSELKEGPKARQLHRVYNNRRGSIAKFVGLYGVYARDIEMETSATRFWKEWLMFSIYPGNVSMEMYRGVEDIEHSTKPDAERNPFRGASYAWVSIADYSLLADAKARRGNPELYTFKTRGGTNFSEPGVAADNTAVPSNQPPKSLDQLILKTLQLQNKGWIAYSFSDKNAIPSTDYWKYRVDGRSTKESKSPTYVFDTWSVLPNRWYKNTTIRDNYRRNASGTVAYPEYPTTVGSSNGYTFSSAVVPAPMFQYHAFDGTVVYPSPLLKVDFGTAPVESGFVKQFKDSAEYNTQPGVIKVTLSGHAGFITSGTRSDNDILTLAQLYNDAAYGDAGASITLTLSGAGIRAGQRYLLTLYGYDAVKNGSVTFAPSGSTNGAAKLSWNAGAFPIENDQYAVRLYLQADANGQLIVKATPTGLSTRISGLTLTQDP